MNTSETIKVAIEFVSKQVDPGGGGIVTPTAQTGDFAIFAIIALVLACLLAFVMFKVSRVYNFGYSNVGNHVSAKNAHRGGRFATKTSVIIAICAALIACLGIATTKAIAANASNGLVVQPDKIQIPIDETTGQPDPANFKFINDSTDNYLFDTTLMSLTDEVKSLTSAEDWGINITGGNTTIFAGEPDGETQYEIENIQTLKPAQSMDSVLTFTKFDADLAKKLIGKQVFSLTLNYNDQKVAPNPKVNTGLIYNREEQTGVEDDPGYTLEGTTKATNANDNYTATAKLADGYDVWEDGTTAPKTIVWSIAKSKIAKINVKGTTKTVPYRTGTSHKFPDVGDIPYTLSAIMAPGYEDIFDENEVSITPDIQPIVQSEINTYPLGLNTDKYSWSYNNDNVLFNPNDFVIQDAYLVITDDPIPVAKPEARTDLMYTGDPLTGVEKTADGYTLTGNIQTDVPLEGTDYEAIATLDNDHIWDDGSRDVLHIHWTIAKAEGGFSEDPEPSSELVYSTEKQKLIKPGTVDYEANVYYMVEGETTYSTEIPEGIDARSYNVKAYIGESRNYEATEPITLTATIEKAVVSNVTIQGAIGDADYIKDASYVFPDFDHGEEAYTITSWEVEKGPKNVFKKEQVRPLPTSAEHFEQVIITKASAEDIGPYDFILPDKTQWSYEDSNVEVKQDAWNPIKGCFTLNESSIVSLEVNITSSKTEYLLIDETVEYTVNITNNTEESISGAKITFGSQDYSVETIPAKGIQIVKINYKIVADDFLYYPNLVKKFIFKHNDFSKQVQHQTSLKNKIIVDPTLYNGFYDKTEHEFPTNEGYTFLGGYDTSFNAGYYYAVVMRNLGYEWESWPYDYNVYTWEIKKINVNICFVTPDETNTFTATYGDNWDVHAQSIVAKTTDVETLPDSVYDILGGDPDGWSNYAQWSKVGVYEAQVVLPSPTNSWNINYNITKTDARLNIVEKGITITWPAEKEFKYTGDVINIEFTINGSLSEHPATVSYTTYADQARTTPKPFKDTGSYYVSAHLGTDADSSNYKITEGAQPSEAFEIKNALNEWPKAVLGVDYNLKFIYDDLTYKPDGYFILKVYDIINTSYIDGSSDKIDPQWYQDAGIIKKVTITPNFVNCSICSDGTTALTSMDSWFAGMVNLEKIEGLENIHAGITSLNATFMKTKLDDYTFPKGFFNGVVSTHSMFKDCASIEEIGVFDWTYASFTDTTSMFDGCSSLKHIYCTVDTNWAGLDSLTESTNMFNGCSELHKHSDLNKNDKTYAKVDVDDSENQGYFEFPSHEYLYQYSIVALKDVSDYLAKNYSEDSQDPICLKFRNFRNLGLTNDGSDNGVAMKDDFSSHWAIDKNGKLFGQEGFVNDNTTIQARIIGICEDYADKERTQKIGLTFMTTHSLNSWGSRQAYHDKDAAYGWGGDSPTGSCVLRAKLNDGSLFPKSLIDSVKKAAKGFQYSGSLGSGTAYDKFWAPSMIEMYGISGGDYGGWWPDENEGIQYKIFVEKVITHSSCAPFSNLDIPQNGDTDGCTLFVWSRSLCEGYAGYACGVYGNHGGHPDNSGVDGGLGVVSCFCI